MAYMSKYLYDVCLNSFIHKSEKNKVKSIHSFYMVILSLAGSAASIGCGDPSTDTPSYTVGQKCPEHITYDGICDGNKVIYCNNDGVIEEEICATQCMVKEAYTNPFAECYYECGNIDFQGICAGDGYNYCHETEGLIHITCDSGQTCGLKGDVYACI